MLILQINQLPLDSGKNIDFKQITNSNSSRIHMKTNSMFVHHHEFNEDLYKLVPCLGQVRGTIDLHIITLWLVTGEAIPTGSCCGGTAGEPFAPDAVAIPLLTGIHWDCEWLFVYLTSLYSPNIGWNYKNISG